VSRESESTPRHWLSPFSSHQIKVSIPYAVKSHVEDVGAALGSDQGQVNCVLKPDWRLLPDGLQAFRGVPFSPQRRR